MRPSFLRVRPGGEQKALKTVLLGCGNGERAAIGNGIGPEELTLTSVPTVPSNIARVYAGWNSSYLVTQSKEVYSWGQHPSILGHFRNTSEFVDTPTKVDHLSILKVAEMAIGRYHGVCLNGEGDVFTWGDNSLGQLGLSPDTKMSILPKRVEALVGLGATKVMCGLDHTIVLTPHGVYGFGLNSDHQIHAEDTAECHVPVLIQALQGEQWVDGACTSDGTLLRSASGKVVGFGWNELNQLCSRGDGKVSSEGENVVRTPKEIPALSKEKIVAMACGESHGMVLVEGGGVKSWGYDGGEDGILGRGPGEASGYKGLGEVEVEEAMVIRCGYHHSMVACTNGEVYAFGRGEFGKLGLGDEAASPTPSRVEGIERGVVDIALGVDHSLVVLEA